MRRIGTPVLVAHEAVFTYLVHIGGKGVRWRVSRADRERCLQACWLPDAWLNDEAEGTTFE